MTSFLQEFAQFFTTDQPWAFFLTYRFQTGFGSFSLAINLILAFYAFGAGDCFNPHTSMWRTQLVIDILVAGGYILDATSAFRFQEPLLHDQPLSFSVPNIMPMPTSVPITSNSSNLLLNSTVISCTAHRPYLFITLIARQWAAMLVLIMGMERLLFVRYPLWFKSIRVRKGPINVFALFFALFSTGIAYTNAMYVTPNEHTHFTCEVSWAFGQDYGWIFYGIVIIPQVLGCLFCIISAIFVHHEQALRRFGGNRQKLAGEKRKIRKVKWLLITCFAFVAVPQSLLLILHILAPSQLFMAKLLLSQLFLAKCFGNILVYNRAVASTGHGILAASRQWWKKRTKTRVNPNESINSISHLIGNHTQQPQQPQPPTVAIA